MKKTETLKIKHFEVQQFVDENGKTGAEIVGILENGDEIRLENFVSIGNQGDYCRITTDIICTAKETNKVEKDLCKCNHERNSHGISHSINYTEGVCKECKCVHFLIK